MKILIADDSKTTLAILEAQLQKLGAEVIAVNGGKDAIEAFKQNRPDLIILDVVMESVDGYECARQIREISKNDWIPIIFLSSSIDDISIEKGIDAGGDDYLTKPCSEITLAAKIKAMQRIADMRKKLYETTQKLYLLSSTDSVTGLYNRLQFERSLKETLADVDRHHHTMALLFLDLDHFKNINDTYGHHIGDEVLEEVAKRLREVLRTGDFIARLGGDEFAIILKEIKNHEEVEVVSKKLIAATSDDMVIANRQIRTGVSIGAVIYPGQGTNKENLILNADVAMYHAKATGRNNVKFFNEDLNVKYKQHVNFEIALKFALENNELYVTYQPIYDLANKKIIGFESILNWHHQKFGDVPANVFIPIAEESGMMPKFINWQIDKLLHDTEQWNLPQKSRFMLHVTTSYLLDNALTQLRDGIKYSHLTNHQLELEFSEGTIMANTQKLFFTDVIKQLHQAGIRVAIKDFGTGYSSFTVIKQLAINTIKIEKSFIEEMSIDPNAEIIVNTIISLANNLNLEVIADGIQNQQQLSILQSKSCLYGQGNFLTKPLKHEQMKKYLQQQKEEPVTG